MRRSLCGTARAYPGHGWDPGGSFSARGGCAKHTSRHRVSEKPPLARLPSGPGRRPCGCLPWPMRPSCSFARKLRGPGLADAPTRGGDAAIAGKCRVEGRPAPPIRNPGSAGQPGFRCRTGSFRRSLPSPDRDWDVPTELSGSPKGPPQPADLRPEGRCTLRTDRSEDRPIRRPGGTEAPPRPLHPVGPRTRKSLAPRVAPPWSRSSRRGPHPPFSGAFTCKKMLAQLAESDNRKLPVRPRFLCIVSFELHKSFTSCPQLYPQPAGRRFLCGLAATWGAFAERLGRPGILRGNSGLLWAGFRPGPRARSGASR